MNNRILYVFLVIWGAIEILLFAGLIFGWASLVYIFKLDKYFDFCDLSAIELGDNSEQISPNSSVIALTTTPVTVTDTILSGFEKLVGDVTTAVTSSCDGDCARSSIGKTVVNSLETCPSQDAKFNLIYTLAVSINGLSTFFNGWILDTYGTFACRACGIVMYAAACLCIILSNAETAILLFPAMILLSWGGYLILLTNFQLANLLPAKRSTIISLYCGAYDSSAFVLVIIKFMYALDVPVQASFVGLLLMLVIVVISTIWFMPTFKIPVPLPDGYKHDMSCTKVMQLCGRKRPDREIVSLSMERKISTTDNKLLANETAEESANEKAAVSSNYSNTSQGTTFLRELIKPMYIWDVTWLTCHRFISWSFVGRLNPRLVRMSGGDTHVVSMYTSVFASLQFFGIFIAPLSGLLMDRGSSKHHTLAERLSLCVLSFVIDTTWGILLTFSMLLPWIQGMYASFVLHVLHRAMLYGPNSAFIAAAFNPHHFGKLFGLAMSFSAGVSLLQYPLFTAIQGPLGGNPLFVDIFGITLMLLSCGHPVYVYLWSKRQIAAEQRAADARQSAIYKPGRHNATAASNEKCAFLSDSNNASPTHNTSEGV